MARLLVGYDGSPPSRRALEHAMRRASATRGDEIILLNVLPPSAGRTGLQSMMPAGIELPAAMSGTFLDTARKRMEEVVAEVGAKGVPVQGVVRLGETAPTFLAVAEEMRAEEILIGHKSYEGPAHTLGPNADAIVRGSKVPVTVVP